MKFQLRTTHYKLHDHFSDFACQILSVLVEILKKFSGSCGAAMVSNLRCYWSISPPSLLFFHLNLRRLFREIFTSFRGRVCKVKTSAEESVVIYSDRYIKFINQAKPVWNSLIPLEIPNFLSQRTRHHHQVNIKLAWNILLTFLPNLLASAGRQYYSCLWARITFLIDIKSF